MKQYIDKSILVAEIKRRIKECDKLADAAADNNLSNTLQANELLISQYTSLLHFINTIETKKVDLDEEFDKYCDTLYLIDLENEPYAELFECAKHFFELGVKAQKGISYDKRRSKKNSCL